MLLRMIPEVADQPTMCVAWLMFVVSSENTTGKRNCLSACRKKYPKGRSDGATAML
jgi:hypothetical protein